MPTLVRSSLAFAFAVTAGLFAVATAAGAVRLLPWLFAPQVPLAVSLPFGRALLARALETALVVGVPVGFAVAAARLVERGEARALHALGMTPVRMIIGLSLPAALLCFAYPFSGASRHDSPGHFARELLDQGRESCSVVRGARAVEVPLVGVTWLCFPGNSPIATGRVPGVAHAAWFTARSLAPSSDLRRFDLHDLRLSISRTRGGLNLRARSARITGLPAWGRPETLGATARALLTAASAWLLALGAVYHVVAAGISSRLMGAAAAGSAAVATLALVALVDEGRTVPGAPLQYVACPLVGLAGLAILGAISRELRARGLLGWAFSEPSLLDGRRGDRKRPANR